MTTRNKNQEIEEAVNRIGSHRLFAQSSTYIGLLQYLVEKTLNNEELNEVTIGSDLYGIDYSENKSNSTVRSYIHKLRKKLAEYYDEKGESETVIIELVKGQYKLRFVSPQEYSSIHKKENSSITIPIKYIQGTGVLVLFIIAAFWGIEAYLSKPSPVWESYFEHDAKNMLVLSDQFVVYEQFADGHYYGVSYPEINSKTDFIKYTQKHPEKKIATTDYTLLTKMAPYTVKPLSLWFDSHGSEFDLELESRIKSEDITNCNIVFVGQYKTMNLSKTLFLRESKAFTTFDDGFKYKTDSIEKIYNTQFEENHKVEYAMVSYSSLSPGKSALYFVSNNDIGVMATVRKFTDKQWLSEFQKHFTGAAFHFNALFEVSGLQRTDVTCKLVELEIR